MKLYGHDTSPYVRRVRVLLAEKGITFTRDSDSWNVPSAAVLRLNPMLRVPALEDGGQVLLDSKVMAAYLYDRYPQPTPAPPAGLPPLQTTLWHPEHRWDDENTLMTVDSAIDSAVNVFLLELDGLPAERSPYLTRQQARIRSCLTWIDNKLADRTTFHPGVFAQLDLALMCGLQWLQFRNRYPIAEHTNLMRFLEAHATRPSLASTHPKLATNAAPPKTPG